MIAEHVIIFCVEFSAFFINKSESFLSFFNIKIPSLSSFSLISIVIESLQLSIGCCCFV